MRTDLMRARIAGLEAGRLRLSAGVNPYRTGSQLSREWESCRSRVEAQRLALQAQARAKTCRYQRGNVPCECGGRGLCMDVA